MAYINNLFNYTNKTTPASPYAPVPEVVCNFGWYATNTSAIFGTLTYTLDGNTYPPPNDTRTWPNYETIDYVTQVGAQVTFDALNKLGITTTINGVAYPLDSCTIPTGVQIIDYSWDFGNGQRAQGPSATTVFTQGSKDGACTLTITDSLGRTKSTTRRLNFINLTPIGAAFNRVVST